jgi:predicted nucleic acid-binding protein
VYAHDTSEGVKRTAALELEAGRPIVISAQILNEFYAAMARPTRSAPLTHGEACEIIREMTLGWTVVPLTSAVTLRALDVVPTSGLSFWDALVWATAKENGVTTIYTEDFQHGRVIEGVRFVNPFVAAGVERT